MSRLLGNGCLSRRQKLKRAESRMRAHGYYKVDVESLKENLDHWTDMDGLKTLYSTSTCV
jgi:hypothetical protein